MTLGGKARDVLSEAAIVHLSSEEDDLCDFTSAAFSASGDLLLAAGGGVSPDGVLSIRVRDLDRLKWEPRETVREATQESYLPSGHKYGVRLVQSSKGLPSDQFLFSSDNGWDHSVRFATLRHGLIEVQAAFNGHRDRVTSIVTPPATAQSGLNSFLTTAEDGTACLWAREAAGKPVFRWRCGGSPVACFDPAGVVVAVSDTSQTVNLYDRRMLFLKMQGRSVEAEPFGSMQTGLTQSENLLSLTPAPCFSSAKPRVNLLVAVGDRSVSVLDTAPSTCHSLVLNLEHPSAGHAAVMPETGLLLRGSDAGDLRAVRFNNGATHRTWGAAEVGLPPSPLSSAVFSPTTWATAFTAGKHLACFVWPYNVYDAP
ncbi:WD repeat-containing protein 82 [Diplonema papillatum]|nr:WD repeat-containing protein 82 [Diplonema papillatum]|eukprot:gene2684-4167_t